jgi:uncharacterized membrane-anchored protein YhcB (DUF1043 family)
MLFGVIGFLIGIIIGAIALYAIWHPKVEQTEELDKTIVDANQAL